MTTDLAALEDPTLAGYVQSIPLNVDPFPYQDLQAQGRYPIQSTPDTIPQMIAYLAGVDAENGQGGRVGYIDDQHRLLVHDPSSGGSGGIAPQQWYGSGSQIGEFVADSGDVVVFSGQFGNFVQGAVMAMKPNYGVTPSGRGTLAFTLVNFADPTGQFLPICVFAVDFDHAPESCVQSAQIMLPIPVDNSIPRYNGFKVWNNLAYNASVSGLMLVSNP